MCDTPKFSIAFSCVTLEMLLHSFVQAKDDDLRGDEECAKRKGRIALFLNILSVVLTLVGYAIIIGVVVKTVTSCTRYYNYYYYTYVC